MRAGGGSVDYYIGAWKKYAMFDGRARRKEYWMFFLINFFIILAIAAVETSLSSSSSSAGNGVLSNIYSLAVFIPSLAIAVRRIHDTGHPGWWILVPFVNFVFLVTPGQAGSNAYGPDPLDESPTLAPPVTPAGWLADPTRRHQIRYRDGFRWTDTVADNGVTSIDPVDRPA